jgi:choline-glycine betaine transporter
MVITRRNLLGLFVADVVIFVLSNVTSKSNSHPGAVSNVLWVMFLIGALALIVLGIAAAIRSARSRRASA